MQPPGHSEHPHQTGPSVPKTSSTRQPRYSPRQQQTHHNNSWQQQQRSPGRSPRNGFRQSTPTSSKPINMTLTNAEALVNLQSITPGNDCNGKFKTCCYNPTITSNYSFITIFPDDQLVVVLVGLPGCGKSTVAAAIAGIENLAAGTAIVENSEDNGSRTNDISQSHLNLNHDHDNEIPSPLRDIEVEEEGHQEQEQEQEQQSRRKWVVTCQDILKTRKKVLQVASGALMDGHSVLLIDPTTPLSHRLLYLLLTITQYYCICTLLHCR